MSAEKAQAQTEIPVLKKKEEKEKKGGGLVIGQSSGGGGGFVARWFGAGVRPAGQALGVGRVGAGLGAGRAAVQPGILPALVNFLASNAAMALLTAGITGGAVYTLYTLGMNAAEGGPARSSPFPVADSGGETARTSAEVANPGSLGYLSGKIEGAGAADGEGAADAAGAAKDEYEEVPEPGAAEGKGAPEGGGGAPDIADSISGIARPQMVSAKGFGASRSVGGGSSGVSASAAAGGAVISPAAQSSGRVANFNRKGRPAQRATRAISTGGGAGSKALGQLKFTNRRSVASLGRSNSEGQAFDAAEAFTTGRAGAGGQVQPSGMLGSGGAGITGGPNSYEGPISRNFTGEEKVRRAGKGGDKSPWTKDVMLAMSLLMTASTIITIIGILALLKNMPMIGTILTGIQLMLYVVATAMAATATALGIMIMTKHGQQTQGAILTTGGGITTSVAAASLAFPQSMPSWASVLGGIAGMAAAVAALLSSHMGGK